MKPLLRLFCFFFILGTMSAAARDEAVRLVTFDYPPYEYQDAAGADGIVVRIVRRAFAHMGEKVVIHVLPWKRALTMVRAGTADGIFTAYKTEARLRFLDYSQTVLMPQTLSIWARRGSRVPYDGTLESLSDTPLGLVRDISYGAHVDGAVRARALRMLDYAPVSAQNITKLLVGRTDAVIMNRYGAMYHLAKQQGTGKVVELQPEISSVPSYIAFSKVNNLTGLRDRLDAVLETMITSGEYQAIIDGYFAEMGAPAPGQLRAGLQKRGNLN